MNKEPTKPNSSENSVKIKSPNHSAGQSYTMILPDNNVEAGKFLKVKSVTGTPANEAVGQLEYATLASPDLTQLNASNLTSGTLPTSVLPSSFNATTGAGLQLVSRTTMGGASSLNYLDFTFDDNSMYRLIFKKLFFNNILSSSGGVRIYSFDSATGISGYPYNGTNVSYQNMWAGSSWAYTTTGNWNLKTGSGGGGSHNFTGIFDFSTSASTGWATFMAMNQGAEENYTYGYFQNYGNYGNAQRLYGLRFEHENFRNNSSYNIVDCDVLLYKYKES